MVLDLSNIGGHTRWPRLKSAYARSPLFGRFCRFGKFCRHQSKSFASKEALFFLKPKYQNHRSSSFNSNHGAGQG